MIPLDLHYELPKAAYALISCFIVFLLFLKLFMWREGLALSKLITVPRSKVLFWLKVGLYCTSLLFLTLALMGPVGNGRYPDLGGNFEKSIQSKGSLTLPLKRKAHTVFLLVDVSASMGVNDMRQQKNRLQSAKEIAEGIIDILEGETVALIAFTSEAMQLSPPTNDYIFVRLSLRELTINDGGLPGTDFLTTLADVEKKYFPSTDESLTHQLKTLIILSDGGDTAMEALSGQERQKRIDSIVERIHGAARNNLRVFTIGMGTSQGGIIPEVRNQGKAVTSILQRDLLKDLAIQGRGKYIEANQLSSLQLAKSLHDEMAVDAPYYEAGEHHLQIALDALLGGVVYERYFQVPLGLALIALAAALLLPSRSKGSYLTLLLCCSLPFSPLHGELKLDPTDLTPRLHQAQAEADVGRFDEARSIYERLRAAVSTPLENTALRYNIATTYLQEHDYDEALKLFQNLDALHNMPPYLLERIKINLVLTLYGKALAVGQREPGEAISLLNSALFALNGLQLAEREPLEELIKVEIAKLRLEEEKMRAMGASALKHVEMLKNASVESVDILSNFPKEATKGALLKEYCKLFSEEQKSILPLWKATYDQLAHSSAKREMQRAESYYTLMIEKTKECQFEEAIDAGKSSAKILDGLFDTITDASPFKLKLYKLQNEVERFARRKGLSKETLEVLIGLYSEVIQQAEKEDVSIREALSISYKRLEAVKQGMKSEELFNLNVEDGMRWLQLAISLTPRIISLEVLTAMIREQEYLIGLIKKMGTSNSEDEKKALMEILKEGMGGIALLIPYYYTSLYKEQALAFRQLGLCQAAPWGDVLPLIYRGSRAHESAASLLQDKPEDTAVIEKKLSQAQALWQQALSLTDQMGANDISCSSYSSFNKEERSSSRSETLSTLLQMELDDRIKGKSQSVQQNVLYPW